jgi:hypothetical protein
VLRPGEPQLGADGRVYFRYGGGATCSGAVASVPVTGGAVETEYAPGPDAGLGPFALSPDGRLLVANRFNHQCWTGGREPSDLVLRDRETGDERVLYSSDRLNRPRLSFDTHATRIAFDTTVSTWYDDEVQIIELDGRSPAQPRRLPNPEGCQHREPQFVPGTDQLIVHEVCGFAGRIVLVDAATGQSLRTLLEAPAETSIGRPVVDRGGRHVLVPMVRAATPDLYRIPLTGGPLVPLYPQPTPGLPFSRTADVAW